MIHYFEHHGVLDNVHARGAEIAARLRAVGQRYAIAGELRGRGLLYCLDFVDPATGGPLSSAEPVGTARPAGGAAARPPRPRLSPQCNTPPPLVLTAAEATEIADIFEESVSEVNEQVLSGAGVDLDVGFGL